MQTVASEGPIFLPPGFSELHTEHGARGLMAYLGSQLGISKPELNNLGRWKPQESVDDYVRDNRLSVLRVVKRIVVAVRSGWRPDESFTVERALDRCGDADASSFAFSICFQSRIWMLKRRRPRWNRLYMPVSRTGILLRDWYPLSHRGRVRSYISQTA